MTYAAVDSKFGIACANATPSAAKQTTPATTNTSSEPHSGGQSSPKNTFPATTMIAICSAVLVTALAATPPR